MDTATITMRDDDIFRWRYRAPGDDRQWGRYHCCSQIAVFRAGRLQDTYWMIGNSFPSDGRSFGADRFQELELTYVGNFADIERAKEYQADYYDDADIVNLNHCNSTAGNFYLRKGAKRSKVKMLESARRKLEKAQSNERAAQWQAEQLRTRIALIEAGDLDTHI